MVAMLPPAAVEGDRVGRSARRLTLYLVLLAVLLVGLMAAHRAAGGCAEDAVAGHVTGDPADRRALEATFGLRTGRGERDPVRVRAAPNRMAFMASISRSIVESSASQPAAALFRSGRWPLPPPRAI